MTIKRSEKIGIVGHSGSGKSTLSKLILGLYKINLGHIKFDQHDFYSYSHKSLLVHIAQVLQETEMLNVSLRNNITMFKEVDEDLLIKSIEIAQLNDLIAKLPDGLETLIGERGYKLSGGERQRVGIARAICKDADILILDEATSALDSKTEAAIQQGIDALKEKTIIMIAHRLSTLKGVDNIVVFDTGRIIEQGTYQNLVNDKNSIFYGLLQMQN